MNAKIISCAIIDNEGIIYSLPAPARHPHILNAHGGLAEDQQGFLTSEGKFVSREEALQIAKAAGQIINRCGGDDDCLFSENLWRGGSMSEELKPCPFISGYELNALKALRDEKAFFGPDGGLWTESGPLEVDIAKAISTLLDALKWHQHTRPIEDALHAELAHKEEEIKALYALVGALDRFDFLYLEDSSAAIADRRARLEEVRERRGRLPCAEGKTAFKNS